MIHHIESELKRHGSKGVHLGKSKPFLHNTYFLINILQLGMAPNNTRAFGFYAKLGFIVLAKDHDALWLGKKFV